MESVCEFWKVFRILGSVFEFWEVFWIPGSVVDSRKCFVPMSNGITQYTAHKYPIYKIGFPVGVAIAGSVSLSRR